MLQVYELSVQKFQALKTVFESEKEKIWTDLTLNSIIPFQTFCNLEAFLELFYLFIFRIFSS